jgi:hypothetical protein
VLNIIERQVVGPKSATLEALIKELARTHYSRYPVDARWTTSERIQFRDPRYPSFDLGELVLDDGGVKIYSPLIANNKFREGTSAYKSKKTSDLKKMRMWLKEYVRCMTPEQIVAESSSNKASMYFTWVMEAQKVVEDRIGGFYISRDDVLFDAATYVDSGVPYSTKHFSKFHDPEIAEVLKEFAIRRREPRPSVFMLLNPDNVVHVYDTKDNGFQKTFTEREQTTYDNLAADLREKIAILRLSEMKKIIPQVGVRETECCFWLA